MIYDLGSEISGLQISNVAKRKLYTVLKNIVNKPGQIKVNYEASIILVSVETDEYEGAVVIQKKQQNKMNGGFKSKTTPQSVILHDEDYSTRYIEYNGENKGIYDVRFTKDKKGRNKVVSTFYDGEVLDYLQVMKSDTGLLTTYNSVRQQLEPMGLLPDYEGTTDAKNSNISINPSIIIDTIEYFKIHVPNESSAPALKF